MELLKNLKFIRKIQLGFLLLGAISTLIALSDIYQINKMTNSKAALYTEFIQPKEKIDEAYLEFQKIQFIMLKFSIPEFQSDFSNNIAAYNFHKKKVDELLDSLNTFQFEEDVLVKITDISSIWSNYKNIVADAIISASASQTYDMAAIIATTSGEEVGTKLINEINDVESQLEMKSAQLNNDFQQAEEDSLLFLVIGMIIGSITLILSVFYLAPKLSKPIKEILNLFYEFSLGNFDVNIKSTSKDEFGEIMSMANQFKHTQIEKIVAAQKIAEGSLERVKEASEKDTLAQAFNKEVNTLEDLLSEIDLMLEANERGDLSVKLDTSRFSGGWARILEGLNTLRKSMLAPINEARSVLRINGFR